MQSHKILHTNKYNLTILRTLPIFHKVWYPPPPNTPRKQIKTLESIIWASPHILHFHRYLNKVSKWPRPNANQTNSSPGRLHVDLYSINIRINTSSTISKTHLIRHIIAFKVGEFFMNSCDMVCQMTFIRR